MHGRLRVSDRGINHIWTWSQAIAHTRGDASGVSPIAFIIDLMHMMMMALNMPLKRQVKSLIGSDKKYEQQDKKDKEGGADRLEVFIPPHLI